MKRAPLLAPALGVLMGIALEEGGWSIPSLALALAGLFAALGSLRLRDLPAALALALAAVSAGALRHRETLAEHAAMLRSAPVDGAVTTVRGEVLERLEDPDPGTGEPRRCRLRLALEDTPGALLLASLDAGIPGRPGERVALTGAFRAPRPPSNPGGYDGLAWALRQGLLGSLSVGGPDGVKVLGPAEGVPAALRRLRERLHARIRARFATPEAELLDALLLGIREPLDQTLSDAFLETGTVHYLAISGTHILVILGTLALLLGWTPLGFRARAGILILAAAFYAALVGFQAPVARSALTASLAAAAALLGRPRAAWNALCSATIAIALYDPSQAFRPGFQLSFLAVAGILALFSPLKARLEACLSPGGWLGRYLIDALAVSAAAWMAVLPLVAWHFHLVTPVVVLANLLVFPLVTLGMGAGAVAMLCPAWMAGPWILASRACLRALDGTVRVLAEVPGGHFYVAGLPAPVLAGAYLTLLLVAWRLRGGKRPSGAWLGAGGATLALGWALWPLTAPFPGGRLTLLDVHHGLCAVIQLPGGGTLLYDCGAYRDPTAGSRVIAPALWALGVKRIDAVMVSHPHDDHVNALPALRRRFPIGQVMTSKAARASPGWGSVAPLAGDLPVVALSPGDRIDLGVGSSAELLHPPDLLEAAPNDLSACLKVTLGRTRILLTGDLEDWGTALLLASGRDLDAEVLLQPHHGAPLGPEEPLLSAVRPREIWVSAREGFASPRVLAQAGTEARVRETAREGAVLLDILPVP